MPSVLPSRPAAPARRAENRATSAAAWVVTHRPHIVDFSRLLGGGAARSDKPTTRSARGRTRYALLTARGSTQPRNSSSSHRTLSSPAGRDSFRASPCEQFTNEARISAGASGRTTCPSVGDGTAEYAHTVCELPNALVPEVIFVALCGPHLRFVVGVVSKRCQVRSPAVIIGPMRTQLAVFCGALSALALVAIVVPNSAPAAGGPLCQVTDQVNQWSTGFTSNLTVTNNGPALTTWTVTWTFGGNEQVTQAGSGVTATNASFNGVLPTGGSVSFGFQATYSGANGTPADFAVNG